MELKKATTIEEAYQVFETNVPLNREQNREFYVDIYHKDLLNLRKDLKLNQIPDKSFFVTGQSGNGKSTALNFLPDESINTGYDVKYLNGRDVFKLDDIDIIDIILMIGYTIVKGNKPLEKKYLAELETFKKKKLGKLEKQNDKTRLSENQSGGDVSLRAKLPVWSLIHFDSGFFAKFKIEKSSRETVREIFTLDKLELVEQVNVMIQAYRDQENSGKKLLIIIDDLEKIRDHGQTRELFIDNIDVFQRIKCVKILTFPVYLAARHAMFQGASKFSIRISENPHSPCKEGIAQKSRALLADVIYKRLKTKALINVDAVQTAVEFSGGNLRFLMDIMQKASRNAIHLDGEKTKNTRLMKTDVDSAVSELAELPSLSVMRRVRVLKYVLDRKQEPEDEAMQKDFIDSVLDNSIYAYFNGHPWYEVNPVIKDSVTVYSRKSGPFSP
jgi:energy-coupling factor transporter ATP-binding protein EcfA2